MTNEPAVNEPAVNEPAVNEPAVAEPEAGIVVEVSRMVHGGHALAFHEGRTLLVRHAMPGERVRVRVTGRTSRVWHAEATEVIDPDPRRVVPPCSLAVPGGCGGCDWQFAPLDMQRSWKGEILAESFRRFAPDVRPPQVPVQALDASGLGWRTRATWHADLSGRAGYRANRSTAVVVPDACLVLTAEFEEFRANQMLTEERMTAQHGERGRVAAGSDSVIREVRGRGWRIPAQSFWQAHARLPRVLVEAVLGAGRPQAGETWWDLYAGAGLLSAFVADAVGPAGAVHAVEADEPSVRAARRALHDRPTIRLHHRRVEDWLASIPADAAQPAGIVLDPPRTGIGALVARAAGVGARVIVYVACDPVALARDAQTLAGEGYRLATLAAFDAFPMTHHMECVASFEHEIS